MYARWRRRDGEGAKEGERKEICLERRNPRAAQAAAPSKKASPALPLPLLVPSFFPSKKFSSCFFPPKRIFSSLFPSKDKYASIHTIPGSAKRAAAGAKRCSAFGAVNPLSKKKAAKEPHGSANPGGTNGNASVVAQTASVEAPTSAFSRNPPSENANGKTRNGSEATRYRGPTVKPP